MAYAPLGAMGISKVSIENEQEKASKGRPREQRRGRPKSTLTRTLQSEGRAITINNLNRRRSMCHV